MDRAAKDDEDDGHLPVKGKEMGLGGVCESVCLFCKTSKQTGKQTNPWLRPQSLFAFAMSFHLSLYVLV